MNETLECEWCGNDLTQEEIDDPEPEGTICQECYHEHFEFTCCRCCKYDHIDYQDMWLVVFEAVEDFDERDREIQPAIYEIVGFPYYGGSLLGSSWLHGRKLRLMSAKIDFDDDGYACGHLCRVCIKALKLRHSKKGKTFHAERLSATA